MSEYHEGKTSNHDKLEQVWVQESEKARGRQWQGIGPLTLEILASALQAQHPQLSLLTVHNARQLCALPHSLSLILSSLGSTELMWLFHSLTTLDLANNFLTQIQGIGECHNLTKLNISHNKLHRLTGLAALHHLEVLSAQHNLIDRLSSPDLHGLDNLQVINLGSNLLASAQDIIALRVLPRLKSLTAEGNPVTEQHPQLVLALLPQLVFIDGRRVKDQLLRAAAVYHREEVAEVAEEEREKKASEEQEEQQHTAATHHKQAGVAGLDDGSVFALMLDGDVDIRVFLCLPGADKLLAKYEEQLKCACVQVFEAGMAHDHQRHEELRTAGDSLQEAYREADLKARAQVMSLAAVAKDGESRLQELCSAAEKRGYRNDDESEPEDSLTAAEALKEAAESRLEEVAYDMLEREVVLADQVMEVIEKADTELRQMVEGFLSTAGAQFVEARHHAYSFYCQLRELCARFADSPSLMTLFCSSFSDDGKPDNGNASLLEAAQLVFQGEDTLALSQAAIHDRHLDIITAREQQLQQHLQSWLTSTVQAMHRQEWRRHRLRIQEINTIVEEHRRALLAAGESIFAAADSASSSGRS